MRVEYSVHARHPSIVLALAAALAASACTGSAKVRVATPPTSPTATPTPTASATPTPTLTTGPTVPPTPATPTPILTDERTVALGFSPGIVVPAGPVVYAVGAAGGTVTVGRIDVDSTSVTVHRSFPGDNAIAASVGGGALALLRSNRNSATLTLLDLKTLAVSATRTFAAAGDVLARPEAVYVSTPGRLLALDPRTLTTRRTILVDDDPQQGAGGARIAADPRSHVLYAGVPSSSRPLIDVVDLRTGHVLARTKVDAVVGADPQGYGDDAWAVFATGMMATAELLTPAGHVRATLSQIGPNSATIAVTGRHLWTFAPGFRDTIDCHDLRTGADEGSAANPAVSMATAADNTHVYLGADHDLLVFTPSGRCA